MDQLLSEFLSEADELIEGLADDVQALRSGHQDGRKRRELVGRIFRHAHTLKGSSSALELTAITEITHEFENLLDSVRAGRSTLDESVFDVFEETISSISQMLGVIADERQPLVPRSLVERLRGVARYGDGTESRSDSGSGMLRGLPEEIATTLSETEKHRLHEALDEGAGVFAIEINLELSAFDTEFRELSNVLSKCGEIISTQPGNAATSPQHLAFRIIYASDDSASQLRAMLTQTDPIEIIELVARTSKKENTSSEQANPIAESESAGPSDNTPLPTRVRVDLSALDEVSNATHALFKTTMDAFDLAGELNHAAKGDPTELKLRVGRIRGGFEDLERNLFELRTIPVVQTMARAIRAGEAAARAAGKEIDFEVKGGDTRIDKALSSAIADPLLHLLRNAVDHGIESSSERVSLGKNVRGLITLETLIEDGQIRVRVVDDGRGIDTIRVTRAAIDRGMIQSDSVVSRKESLRIIFAPGFSTAETISDVSGRGVGLDVVSRAIEESGGKIFVRSEVGVGTTFELVIPTAKTNGSEGELMPSQR